MLDNRNYQYPLDLSWSSLELAQVVSFFNRVEEFYETSVSRAELLAAYRVFKTIVPSKMQEKQLDREFEKISGYSTYRALQEAKRSERQTINYKA